MNGRNQYSTVSECRNGHSYTDGSVLLIQRKDGTMKRTCKKCNAVRNARWYESKVKPTLTGRRRYSCTTEDCTGTYNWSKMEMCKLHQRRTDHTRHRERHRACGRRWAKNNREKMNNNQNRRRAVGGNFSASAWVALKALFGHLCAYCRQRFDRLEQDHVVPLVRGGLHAAGNIVPACRSCNATKGAN